MTTVHKKQPSSTAQPIKKPKAKAASPVYISDESSSLSEEDSDSREEPAMTEGDNLPDEEDDDDNDEEDEEEEEEEDSDSLDKPLDSLDRAFARDLEELEEDDDYADTEEESVNAMVALPPLSDCERSLFWLVQVLTLCQTTMMKMGWLWFHILDQELLDSSQHLLQPQLHRRRPRKV